MSISAAMDGHSTPSSGRMACRRCATGVSKVWWHPDLVCAHTCRAVTPAIGRRGLRHVADLLTVAAGDCPLASPRRFPGIDGPRDAWRILDGPAPRPGASATAPDGSLTISVTIHSTSSPSKTKTTSVQDAYATLNPNVEEAAAALFRERWSSLYEYAISRGRRLQAAPGALCG